jgi:hypothetical protein
MERTTKQHTSASTLSAVAHISGSQFVYMDDAEAMKCIPKRRIGEILVPGPQEKTEGSER